jgi:putative flippase GtrA
MKIMITHFDLPYKILAQACGIASGMAVNFMVSKFIVFRKGRIE